jgi:hypothetical protein
MNSRVPKVALSASAALFLCSNVAAMNYSASLLTPRAPHILQTKRTEANWRSHVKIKAIERLVKSIDLGLKKHSFKSASRDLDCGDWTTVKRIARDSSRTIRWYDDYSAGQDSSTDVRHYYDSTGHLRFVIAFARAANGTREQLRLYFNESGKRIWQNRISKGLGCPGCLAAYNDSDEAIAFNPKKAFSGDQGCKEIKVKPKNERSP